MNFRDATINFDFCLFLSVFLDLCFSVSGAPIIRRASAAPLMTASSPALLASVGMAATDSAASSAPATPPCG